MFRKTAVSLLAALGLFALAISAAHAEEIVAYDNTDSLAFVTYVTNGNATNQSGNTITALIADDLTYSSGFSGLSVTRLSFNVVNANASAVSARPLIRIWNSDGASGAPGTLLRTIDSTPISFTGLVAQTFTTSLPLGLLTLPSSGTIWAGLAFDDNNGTTGATSEQLNNLGMGVFDPITVGSSVDHFFVGAGPGSFTTGNPTGSVVDFGSNPPSNFGWALSVTATVPEPSPLALASIGAALPLAVAICRRRKSAQAFRHKK